MRKRIASLLSLFAFVILAFTCGKKAPPLPPLLIAPGAPSEPKVVQLGNRLLFLFQLPTLSTDKETPADVARIEIYRLEEPRVLPATASPPVQTQPQTQTQTQPPTQTQPQTQTQLQTQTVPTPEEQARELGKDEIKERGEKIANIEGPAIESYLRHNTFIFVDPIQVTPESEDFRYWFYYAVKFYNKKGKSAGIERPVANFPAPVAKAPTNLIAKYTEKEMILNWSAVTEDIMEKPLPEGAVKYNVYRGTDANFAPVRPLTPEPIAEATFTDTTFQFGQPYYYFVTASIESQKKSQESEPSNVILIYPQDTFPPAAPEELNAVSASEGIVLIWAPNQEADIAGYNIYRSTQPGAGYEKINKQLVVETTFTDRDIQRGVIYYYVVTAVDTAPVPNESNYSNEASEVGKRR